MQTSFLENSIETEELPRRLDFYFFSDSFIQKMFQIYDWIRDGLTSHSPFINILFVKESKRAKGLSWKFKGPDDFWIQNPVKKFLEFSLYMIRGNQSSSYSPFFVVVDICDEKSSIVWQLLNWCVLLSDVHSVHLWWWCNVSFGVDWTMHGNNFSSFWLCAS